MSNYTSHTSTHNEGGYGYNPHQAAMLTAASTAAEARITSLIARMPALRDAWNAAVTKYAVNGKLPASALAKIEAEVGCTRLEMLAVKARMGA